MLLKVKYTFYLRAIIFYIAETTYKNTTTIMDEKEDIVLNQLKSGDEKGYHYLFTNYYAQLCRIANFYIGDPYIAENLVEDLISHLWEHRLKLEIKSSLRGYLFTAIHNRCRNHIKQASKTYETNFSVFSDRMTDFAFPSLESSGLVTLVGQELDEKIKDCVNNLPDQCRTVFCLSRYENLKYKEISSTIGISVNTVQYHIKNALATLRVELREYL